jgi:ADP-heptose:LPS heptosyltransferase
LKQFAALLDYGRLFISASTGPMHLAAAVKTPTVSLFCPIFVCSPRRWGPLGNRRAVLIPAGTCRKCSGPACSRYSCMKEITVEKALEACLGLLVIGGR